MRGNWIPHSSTGQVKIFLGFPEVGERSSKPKVERFEKGENAKELLKGESRLLSNGYWNDETLQGVCKAMFVNAVRGALSGGETSKADERGLKLRAKAVAGVFKIEQLESDVEGESKSVQRSARGVGVTILGLAGLSVFS